VLLQDVEGRSLWFSERNLAIWQLIQRHGPIDSLWEIGSGNGFVAAFLQAQGVDVVAVEPDIVGARAATKRGVRASICGTLEGLGLPDNSIGALGLFDVIEHIEDPHLLLNEARRVLRPQGLLVITAPALSWLWSDIDDFSGHFRRYSRRDLDTLLDATGFTRRYSGYMFTAAVPAVFVLRRIRCRGAQRSADTLRDALRRELAGQTRLTKRVAVVVGRLERACSRRLPLPFGTSVLGLYARDGC
jgi:SAM-dependent methyltransferase